MPLADRTDAACSLRTATRDYSIGAGTDRESGAAVDGAACRGGRSRSGAGAANEASITRVDVAVVGTRPAALPDGVLSCRSVAGPKALGRLTSLSPALPVGQVAGG
jgi:hypothetical protein